MKQSVTGVKILPVKKPQTDLFVTYEIELMLSYARLEGTCCG